MSNHWLRGLRTKEPTLFITMLVVVSAMVGGCGDSVNALEHAEIVEVDTQIVDNSIWSITVTFDGIPQNLVIEPMSYYGKIRLNERIEWNLKKNFLTIEYVPCAAAEINRETRWRTNVQITWHSGAKYLTFDRCMKFQSPRAM